MAFECEEEDDADEHQHRRRVPCSILIDETHDRRAGALGLQNEILHAAEERVGTGFCDLDVEDAGEVDRAAKDLIISRFLRRHRLAGDARLIDGARTVDHAAVGRNRVTRPYTNHVAWPQSRGFDKLFILPRRRWLCAFRSVTRRS